VQAVLAVVQHKLTEAANAGHSKATAGAAAAVKQQVAAAQKEAEAKASKQLQDITDQVRHALLAWSQSAFYECCMMLLQVRCMEPAELL
jgi:hypothetical protein